MHPLTHVQQLDSNIWLPEFWQARIGQPTVQNRAAHKGNIGPKIGPYIGPYIGPQIGPYIGPKIGPYIGPKESGHRAHHQGPSRTYKA